MAHIVSTATGFPPHYYPQEELIAGLQKIWSHRQINLNSLETIHQKTSVLGRYLALPMEAYENISGLGQRTDAWIEATLDLGEVIICSQRLLSLNMYGGIESCSDGNGIS